MKKELIVVYDDLLPEMTMVNGENGYKDPVLDLNLLLGGVSVIANTCRTNGIEKIGDVDIGEYMKDYIDELMVNFKPADIKQETVQ